MLKVGIVGLPNVGKSTLFNALLKKQAALAANYPFATIEPNIGIVDVPDSRLAEIARIVGTEKIVPATIEFYDIAGLVAGASEGEGLGNQFLSHIRETSLIVHVVRLFEDPNVVHVDKTPHPEKDIATIETELILSDLILLDKQREPRGNAPKEDVKTWETIQIVKKSLNDGVPAREVNLSDEQLSLLKQFNLITLKKILYLFNVSEKQLSDPTETEKKISEILTNIGSSSDGHSSADHTASDRTPTNPFPTIPNPIDHSHMYLCAQLESELAALDESEQNEYLSQFGLASSGLDRLAKTAYDHLDLISFLTGGTIEARAWTIKKGTKAPQAAGTIHTDFEKHFIKAEIVKYDDFVSIGGWTKARENGKITLAGKDYTMLDGDVVDFKVGV